MLRFVVFIVLFAAVVYAGFWLLDRRSKGRGKRGKGGKGGRGGNGGPRPAPRGPVGPDDDEDFLRELDRKKRHSKDKQKKDDES